jgi:E3 ubiquitin-protein ligase HUWE1
VRVNPSKIHVSGKLIGCGSINSYLLSLAQGWGSKEEGLGLYSCVVSNERTQPGGLSLFPSDSENKSDITQHRLGSTLHFECNIPSDQAKSGGMCVIDIPNLHLSKEEDITILKQCVESYNVPPEHRFSLLTRIRYAHAFSSSRTSRIYTKISLLAFIVLVQSNDAGDELVSFFTNEPEYTNELIRLVRSEDMSVPGSIRALTMLALGAQLAAYASSHERARILSGSSIISAGGNRMVLLGVLQKAILTLNNPTDPSSPVFVDALLRFFLFHVMSTSSSGGSVHASGLVPPLLPLLQDSDPAHMHLVCLAVKILQKLLEYSTPAVSLFKDLGGVQLLAQRLHIEVERVIGTSDEAGASAMVVSEAAKSDEDHLHSQKRLIKALLKALGTATYSPANPARGQTSQDNSNCSLSGSLSLIFRQMDRFGGDIYFSAVSLMSEMIHKDPTCFPALQEQGLPDAFLSSVLAGVVPSSKALISIPNGLGSICLNTRGLESVRESSALRFLIGLFTTRKYLTAMNDGVVLLANAMEELLRHQSSLRSSGVEIIIEILNKLSLMGQEGGKAGGEPSGSLDGVADMETDVEIKTAPEGHDLMGSAGADLGSDGITDKQFIHLCVFHAMVLVHRTMENSESCKLFVEKGGIEILLKLLLRPSITQSSEGMPIALHSTVVFKGFTQHHSAPLARAFSSSLREHLVKALTEVTLDPTSDNHSTPSLFVVEFLLFLAASKDNRWINALLVEFADAGRDVLENIGRVHREALWQIAHLEDSKVLDVDSNSSNTSTSDVQRFDSESGDARLGSLRQYIDPLLRRRGSWSIESQVSDLINIYRDISRVSGARTDRYLSSLERSLGSTESTPHLSDTNPSPSSSTSGDRTVEESKKLSYSSYHDMLTSLSYHIDHLFMELGKAMLLSSRRENNPVNLSPSVVSVAGTIASTVSEHLNFGGHVRPNESEVFVTTKCRYLGKVLYFIDGILLDRPDSCNPIILNCFYSRGVIQLILSTFEATSQLPFTVPNRLPASPMETEDSKGSSEKEDSENMWIYGPLASYGVVLDHLVTSSFILSNSTRQLLEQPIGTGSIQFPQDAETFVKTLQSKVLKVVLPIWTHPHFAECNLEFVSALTSIMRHVYSGVEVKNTGTGNVGSHLAVPPPDESAIALIVEMGFSRARAEEALRQVGTNSVEIATDWLFSHPEEPEEDDDLARALAMSLGNSDSPPKEEKNNGPEIVEEETMQLPSIDEMLTSCIRLLQMRESLAFPVRDMLVTICSQNDGQYRRKVLTFIIDRVREICAAPSMTGSCEISALFHVLALILHDDTAAREAALKAGLAKIALDLLSDWDVESSVKSEKNGVPRWVTSCFLSIDQMLQVEPKLPDITDLELGKDDKEKQTGHTSVIIDQSCKETEAALEAPGLLDAADQKRLLELCCRCMQNHVPSDTMHVVLQLCATLSKVHPIAITFLEVGGLHALLSLPIGCLFSGFNAIAASIIRHILEDPHTLQQAMELEIRHCLITAANRNGSPRVTPRNFVQSLSDVISRDPVVFMRAARNVCQIDMVGDRPYIVQLKEHDKEKSKEKEKDKSAEKDRAEKLSPDQAKHLDTNTKGAKAHRKSPQSFVTVIEILLDLVVTFVPPPLPKTEDQTDSGAAASSSASDMDIDTSASAKAKGKAVANVPEESKAALQEANASVAQMSFLLKLLTDVLLTYASSINVLLRRDAELSSRGPIHSGGSGGVFSHIIHQFLSCCTAKPKKDKKSEGDWRHKMATRSSQFLVASAIRSAEARKRIFSEISSMLAVFVDSSDGCKAPDSSMSAYVDLLNEILGARSPTGSYISAEASSTFVDVGLVHVLTRTLEVLDLDNPESSKVVTGIVKALELVTKEHVHLSDAKGERKASSGPNQVDPSSGADRSQHTEAGDQTATAPCAASQGDSSNIRRAPDSVTDEMEHDYDGEDDFMQDVVAEDRRENNDGISTVEITFNIRHGEEDQMVDDNDDDDVDEDESDRDGNDDDMSGDDDEHDEEDVDDDEDDDGDHGGLEEEEEEEEDMHHMHHPDTDPDDHDMDEEEFDEDMLEEDEDEDEEDEEGVILRLEEGINGINVFDHIEVLGGGAGDTLRVMPLDIFGTRRHGQSGRTTSIYNLLGGRSGADQVGRAEHPLLEEPNALRLLSQQRQSG